MIKKQFKNSFKFLVVTTLAFFLSFGSVYAGSKCKGKEQKACKKDSDCTWVKSHKRKGKEVKAHCKSKGSKKDKINKKEKNKKDKKEKKGKKAKKKKESRKKDKK